MNEYTTDDSKEILAILNSLGIIGLTAQELKIFMKEFKVYKKAKKEECLQWKKETKSKILQKQYYEGNSEMNNYNENIRKCTMTVYKHEKKTRISNKQKDFVDIFADDVEHNISCDKRNNMDKKTPLLLSVAHPRLKPFCRKLEKVIPEKMLTKEKISISPNHNSKKDSIVQKSCKKIKSSMDSEKNKFNGPHSRSKSFIKLQNVHSELKASSLLLNKKSCNDPVTLYNTYTNFWKKLSLPGEEAHASLRWAIRQKMLISNLVVKV